MMSLHRLIFLMIAASSPAMAQSAAVAPFVANGVDAKVAANITALASSEMDFMSEFDGATEIDSAPSMNQWCLDNPGCLAGIGRGAGADQLLGGMVSPSGADNYNIYMVLYDVNGGAYVRKKQFTISSAPEALADGMGGLLSELVTGENPDAVAAAAAAPTADEFDPFDEDEDDFTFAATPSHVVGTPGNSTATLEDFEDPQIAAQREAAARAAADAEARRRAEEAARLAAEQEARRRAEEAARARAAEEERRRQAAAASAAAASSIDDIQFGAVSQDDIQVEDIQFGSAVDLIAVEEADEPEDDGYAFAPASLPTSSRSNTSARSSYDDDRSSRSARSSADSFEDLDDLEDDSRSSRSSRESRDSTASRDSRYDGPSSTVNESKGGGTAPLTITARGGYSRYQKLGFVSYGGELGVPLAKSLYLRVGADAFSVRRDDLPDRPWETILPIGFGLHYQRTETNIRPYVGGDLTITPYTADFKVAPGFRARLGCDFMVVENFGFNANLAAGVWYGADLDQITSGLTAAGLVPQISGGTVFAF